MGKHLRLDGSSRRQERLVFAAPKAGSLLKRSRADALTISDPALRAANDGISGEVELRGVHEFADARLGALVAAVNAERVAGFPSGRLFLDSIELALVNSYALRRPSPPAYRGGLTPARLRKTALPKVVIARICVRPRRFAMDCGMRFAAAGTPQPLPAMIAVGEFFHLRIERRSRPVV